MADNGLNRDFYMNDCLTVAPLLLGKNLVRRFEDGSIKKFKITETEAYRGEEDSACHAKCGRTKRNYVLYESGGIAYVYLCYGIHNLLNVVTEEKDNPQAVLIRGVEGFQGPGKVTKALLIDRSYNLESFVDSERLYIEDDFKKYNYKTSKRVGIGYADEEYREKEWRFILE